MTSEVFSGDEATGDPLSVAAAGGGDTAVVGGDTNGGLEDGDGDVGGFRLSYLYTILQYTPSNYYCRLKMRNVIKYKLFFFFNYKTYTR